MAETDGPEKVPQGRSRTTLFISGVLVSMLLPWLFMALLQGLRPAPVQFDLDQVHTLLSDAKPSDEPGTRTLRIGPDRSRASAGGPWPEAVSFIVARREAEVHEAPAHFKLHAAPGRGDALARSIFITGRAPVRRTLRRHAPAPGESVDEASLVQELNAALGEDAVERVVVSPPGETGEARVPGEWTWPPPHPDAANRGVLQDRLTSTKREQVQLWDMGDETWPLDLPTLALGLAPFPIHQHRQGWGRTEVAGDQGYGLWLTDGRYLVGVVTTADGRPEDTLVSLPFILSVGARSPLATAYDLFDRHTIGALLTCIAGFLLLWSLGVIRGASWAAELRPRRDPVFMPPEELKQGLFALEERLEVRASGDQILEIGWRLDDPAVQDAIGAADGQVAYTVGLVLELDPDQRRIRCQERRIRILWMQGAEDGGYAHQALSSTASGVDFIDRGRNWGEGSSGDSDAPLDLAPAAMKRLVSRVIVEAGWSYRPVLSFHRWISG
ncbi:MAG: hypothetical protein VX938_09755 [Myxococcota bacterium]|nr:hypothetical protein [Myxococcota bacterium]